MFAAIHPQFVSLTKQFADSALKANSLAVENIERVLGLQLKTVESRVNATVAFLGEAAEARDVDAARAIWPKGLNLARESAEQFYGVGQEVLGQTLKTGEAIGALVKQQFELASQSVREGAAQAAAAATESPAAARAGKPR